MALTLEYLFLWFLLYAFIGWVYESVLVSVSERRLVNRGFLNGRAVVPNLRMRRGACDRAVA